LAKQTVFAMKIIIRSLQKSATRNLNAMNGLKTYWQTFLY